jgi:RNA polymerase sigma-70 factor (ECF subfamily)
MEMTCYDEVHTTSAAASAERGFMPAANVSETPSLERWVERAKAGEVGAFEELYRHSVGRVYALCLRMTGDAQEAEEATQDAFVRAWEKLDSFQGRSAFTSWLHRLTVNVVLGRWRTSGRQRDRVVAIDDAIVDEKEGPTPPPPGTAIDLERAIATLPQGARTVFVLFDMEGYGHREIAEMTGLASGTSKAQLHRARQLLRKALGR